VITPQYLFMERRASVEAQMEELKKQWNSSSINVRITRVLWIARIYSFRHYEEIIKGAIPDDTNPGKWVERNESHSLKTLLLTTKPLITFIVVIRGLVLFPTL
jgi:hypothetical protein